MPPTIDYLGNSIVRLYFRNKLLFFCLSLNAISLVSCSTTESGLASSENIGATVSPTIVFPECTVETNVPAVQAYCLFNSATLLKSEGFLPQAKQEFLEVISLDNKRVEAYLSLADIYLEENDLVNAEAMYLASIELDSENSLPFHNLGVIYDSSNKPEKAIANYLEAIRLNPRNPQFHYNLGLAYSRDLNSLEHAIDQFLQAIELDPSLAQVHYDLGRIYEYLDRPELASESFRKASSLNYEAATEKL